MNNKITTIPYCGECGRKIKLTGLKKGEYYCDIVAGTPMNGIITYDTDGSHCVDSNVFRPILNNQLE